MRAPFFPLLALALFAPAGLATHEAGCVPSEAHTTGEVAGIHLMLFFGLDGGTTVGAWQETNAIEGLQLHNEVADHTCGGHFLADAEIFAFWML